MRISKLDEIVNTKDKIACIETELNNLDYYLKIQKENDGKGNFFNVSQHTDGSGKICDLFGIEVGIECAEAIRSVLISRYYKLLDFLEANGVQYDLPKLHEKEKIYVESSYTV